MPVLPALAAKFDHVVFHDRDARIGEHAAHGLEVVPPVVIAEDRPHPERRLEPRQFVRQLSIGQALGLEPVPRDIIAEQHHEIGLRPLAVSITRRTCGSIISGPPA